MPALRSVGALEVLDTRSYNLNLPKRTVSIRPIVKLTEHVLELPLHNTGLLIFLSLGDMSGETCFLPALCDMCPNSDLSLPFFLDLGLYLLSDNIMSLVAIIL